jgi:hypothetical protein
LENEFSEEIK